MFSWLYSCLVYMMYVLHTGLYKIAAICAFFSQKKKKKKGKGADNNVVNAFKVDGWPPFQHNIRRLVG